jgi:hypothetical protein
MPPGHNQESGEPSLLLPYLVLDLSQGTARTLAGPLEPANPLHLVPPAGAASLGASPLFVADKRFLRIDLETGQRHDLGPARQR